MKKLFLSLAFIAGLFVITGCGAKPILYRYNIENINYNEDSYKAYKIDYTITSSGIKTKVSVRIEMNLDGTCQYYSTQSATAGSTVSQAESNCTYQIENENISVTIGTVKVIYNPSAEYISLGYKSSTTYESNVKFDGVLSENGKYLTMGELKYKHVSYLYYLENGINEVLVNEQSKKTYKLNGEPIGNSDANYIKKNKINVSNYQIIYKQR